MTPIKPHGEFCILYIWATPGAAKNRLGEIILDTAEQPHLKVYVTAIAEKGAANKAIIALISKKLDIPKSLIQIISGETDRRKRLLIQIHTDQVITLLRQATGSLF
ncbi:MAG: DUF167 domain-containing protein [Candidatus Paracaedibacteraceae bacterium]|nr:DUF167 domain-containing protein [Candidatus Paracaedibacteraceae bacterium]